MTWGMVNLYCERLTMVSVTENWKPVIGHESTFEVSDLGRVRALPWQQRHWCGKMLPQAGGIIKQSRHSGGYSVVSLRDNRKHYVHRLVMAAFAGPQPSNQDVNHINGDKTDNRLANLEYCDRMHNVRHAIATGLQDNSGEGNGQSKYTTEQIQTVRRMVQFGSTQREAALATGVAESTVQMVATGKRWKHLAKA
jgi:hypothetical protein